MQAAMTRF